MGISGPEKLGLLEEDLCAGEGMVINIGLKLACEGLSFCTCVY